MANMMNNPSANPGGQN